MAPAVRRNQKPNQFFWKKGRPSICCAAMSRRVFSIARGRSFGALAAQIITSKTMAQILRRSPPLASSSSVIFSKIAPQTAAVTLLCSSRSPRTATILWREMAPRSSRKNRGVDDTVQGLNFVKITRQEAPGLVGFELVDYRKSCDLLKDYTEARNGWCQKKLGCEGQGGDLASPDDKT